MLLLASSLRDLLLLLLLFGERAEDVGDEGEEAFERFVAFFEWTLLFVLLVKDALNIFFLRLFLQITLFKFIFLSFSNQVIFLCETPRFIFHFYQNLKKKKKKFYNLVVVTVFEFIDDLALNNFSAIVSSFSPVCMMILLPLSRFVFFSFSPFFLK